MFRKLLIVIVSLSCAPAYAQTSAQIASQSGCNQHQDSAIWNYGVADNRQAVADAMREGAITARDQCIDPTAGNVQLGLGNAAYDTAREFHDDGYSPFISGTYFKNQADNEWSLGNYAEAAGMYDQAVEDFVAAFDKYYLASEYYEDAQDFYDSAVELYQGN